MTTGVSGFHLAGGMVATTASQIADALERLPDARIRVSDEVDVQGEAFELAIYPTRPGQFLISGSLQLSHEASRTLVTVIAKLLDDRGIVFELELSPEEGGEDEVVRHPRFRELLADSVATKPDPGTSGWAVARGSIPIGDRIRSGTADEVRHGVHAGEAVLVTLTGTHSTSLERIRDQLALPFEGIAPLVHVGPCDPGVPYADVLVERMPSRHTLAELAPLGEPVVARLGADVATVAARVHVAGARIDGLRPELIYVDGCGTFVALVPRGPAFIAGAAITRGMRSYHVPFMAPEQLCSSTADASSDVFTLCATLWFAATGKHPFGDPEQVSELASRLLLGTTDPWPGSRELGEVLVRGLSTEPGARPTMPELAAALSRLV